MKAKLLMVQGTASHVGKSVLVTALCRIFRQDGFRVAPFKAQNMSLNAGVTPDGLEIGRAQLVQAEAAGVAPTVDMNPILLKPEADYRAQLVVMGRPDGTLDSKEYPTRKARLWGVVTGALDRLRAEYDVVVVEGAGSPAEVNLRQGDIVNMEVALHARSPVLLIGDIDKGGVFASLYGTVALLDNRERALVQGFVINKFRGDIALLEPGLRQIEGLTAVPVVGVLPYFHDIYVPEEDAAIAAQATSSPSARQDAESLKIVVVVLPHIANFDDFDPLAREDSVQLKYAREAGQIGEPDLIIVPGTKTTANDLAYIRETGIAEAITKLAASGTALIGVCGGLQMLGATIADPMSLESNLGVVQGLEQLAIETSFGEEKQTNRVVAEVTHGRGLLEGADGIRFDAYEIHMGETHPLTGTGVRGAVPSISVKTRSGAPADEVVGYSSEDGWILGSYTHGMFASTRIRRLILTNLAQRVGRSWRFEDESFSQEGEFDKLAALVRTNLDMDAIRAMMSR